MIKEDFGQGVLDFVSPVLVNVGLLVFALTRHPDEEKGHVPFVLVLDITPN